MPKRIRKTACTTRRQLCKAFRLARKHGFSQRPIYAKDPTFSKQLQHAYLCRSWLIIFYITNIIRLLCLTFLDFEEDGGIDKFIRSFGFDAPLTGVVLLWDAWDLFSVYAKIARLNLRYLVAGSSF